MIYDPYSRPFQEDPYPLYQRFRDEEPCTYNPQADFYALFRFEDVWNATLDWETMSSTYGPSLENRGEIPGQFFSIIGMDPPAHTKLRNVVSRGFTPRRIGALEAEIRGIAKHYLEPLASRDGGFRRDRTRARRADRRAAGAAGAGRASGRRPRAASRRRAEVRA